MAATCDLKYATATLTDGSEERIPYWHLDSGQSGEVFLVLAEQHGNEIQGCEVIRRFRAICEQQLVAGQAYLVPFANPLALRHRRSHITLGPEQPYADDGGQNMNRTWPGDAEGHDTARLSHAIFQDVAQHCTRCLDLHSWSRFTATCTLIRSDVELAAEMGAASAIRFQMTVPRQDRGPDETRPISAWFNDSGMAATTIELAPQWVIRENEVTQGLRAATNIAKLFGMIDGEMEQLDGPAVEFKQSTRIECTQTVEAPCSGLFVESGLETSDQVEEGQSLGHIISDSDLGTVEITAPASGYLWQYGCHRAHSDVALPPQHPFADEGDVLAAVMTPDK
jgi:predicted deacylase